jgi:hypothetical protein
VWRACSSQGRPSNRSCLILIQQPCLSFRRLCFRPTHLALFCHLLQVPESLYLYPQHPPPTSPSNLSPFPDPTNPQAILGGFQDEIDALPPVSYFPSSLSPRPPGPAAGAGPQRTADQRELLAPFALRDWCHSRPNGAGPALGVAAEEWIPAGQLDRVAAKGRGPGRRVGRPQGEKKGIGWGREMCWAWVGEVESWLLVAPSCDSVVSVSCVTRMLAAIFFLSNTLRRFLSKMDVPISSSD